MRSVISLALLTIACAPAAKDAAPASGTTPYLGLDPAERAEPALNASEVSGALIDSLVAITDVDPARVQSVFLALLAQADTEEDGCPGITTYDESGTTLTTWYLDEACTSAAGATFVGGATYTVNENTAAEDGGTESGFAIESDDGSFSITGADGTLLEASGFFALRHGENGAYTNVSVDMSGTLHADDASANGDAWLTGARTGQVTAYADHDADSGARSLYVSGSLVNVSADVAAVAVTDLLLNRGGDCDAPSGSVSVRDANAVWHDVVFSEEECALCGTHLVSGDASDAVCVDASALDALFTGELPW